MGGDGNLWFTEWDSDAIGTITLAGVLTEYPTSDNTAYLTLGSDGNVWFTGHHLGDPLASVTPAGVVTPVASLVNLSALTNGPDSNLWVDDAVNGTIDVITTAGATVAQYPTTGYTGGELNDLVEGPDGNIWATTGEDSIGVLNLDPPAAPVAPARPVLASTGVGPGWWIAGGWGCVALVAGLVLLFVRLPRKRRRRVEA
ncbi:MAG: hypothetical protein WDM88_02610 [Galbitalea sp.]